MSSRAITERKDGKRGLKRWRTPVETAPSIVGEDQPLVARLLGGLGVFLLVFAAVALIALQYRKELILPLIRWEIGYGWAGFLGVIGTGLMLLHAARDAELQIRRSYMAFGYVWLVVGIGVSVLPINGPAGSQFLPRGVPCLFVALLFLMAYLRNETEQIFRDVTIYVLGGVGALGAVGGFFFGSLYENFLLPHGVILILLGLLYLWAFVGLVDERYDLGNRTGMGMQIGGVVFFLVAFVRSAVLPLAAGREWISAANGPPYLMPSGLVLMATSAIHVAFGLGVSSDRKLVVMTRRELAAFFQTPIAYIVLFGYAVIGWAFYFNFLMGSLIGEDPREGLVALPVEEPIILNYFIGWFQVIFLLFTVPVVTMRLLSEERRTGTLEMMLSAPVNEWHVVISKFLAAWCIFVLVWLPLGLYLIDLRVEGNNILNKDYSGFDYRPLLGFYIALVVSGAAFISMGLFFSSLTRNQIAAAILTFAGMLALTLIYFLPRLFHLGEHGRGIVSYFSYVDLWLKVCTGKLAARDLVFHASATAFWLFLTVKVLEARKWL